MSAASALCCTAHQAPRQRGHLKACRSQCLSFPVSLCKSGLQAGSRRHSSSGALPGSWRCSVQAPRPGRPHRSGASRLLLPNERAVSIVSAAAPVPADPDTAPSQVTQEARAPYTTHSWRWRGHKINYAVGALLGGASGPDVLLDTETRLPASGALPSSAAPPAPAAATRHTCNTACSLEPLRRAAFTKLGARISHHTPPAGHCVRLICMGPSRLSGAVPHMQGCTGPGR